MFESRFLKSNEGGETLERDRNTNLMQHLRERYVVEGLRVALHDFVQIHEFVQVQVHSSVFIIDAHVHTRVCMYGNE